MELEAHPQISPDPVACQCARVIAAGERYRAFTLHGADDTDPQNYCARCFAQLCQQCHVEHETEDSDA